MRILLLAVLAIVLYSCSQQEGSQSESEHGTVTFVRKSIRDSIPGLPNFARSPQATFTAEYLVPHSDQPSLKTFLDSIVRIGLSGDSLVAGFADVEAAIAYRKNFFFDDYRLTITEGVEDGWIDTSDMSVSHNYDESIVMEEIYTSHDVLTLAYQMYSYTGGAHGNYGTVLQTADLARRHLLRWEDVFVVNADNTQLSALLQTAARAYLEIETDEELASYLFEDQIEANNNFGFTAEGVLFVYVPYEIAPYALGEIRLLLPYRQINSMLRPAYRRE